MIKYIAYMVCGSMFLDLLKDKKNIIFEKEAVRRFHIGILNLNDKGKTEIKNIKKTFYDPYILGYALQLWLNDELKNENLKTSSISDVSIEDCRLWDKYELILPSYRPFFMPSIKGTNLKSYISVYAECEKIKEKIKLNSDSYASLNETEFEAKLIACATSFLFEYDKNINKCKIRKKHKETESNWMANAIKLEYYEQCWEAICARVIVDKKNENKLQLDLNRFFKGLKAEIYDVLSHSDEMLKNRNLDEKRVIWIPFIATVFNAVAVGLQGTDKYAISALFVTFAATIMTALQTVVNAYKTYNASEETWLRHQLNFSRLTSEIEEFCEGIGKYEKVWSGDSNDVLNEIKKFQENIAALRKQDYANFFTNMNCINYDTPQVSKLVQNNKSEEKSLTVDSNDSGSKLNESSNNINNIEDNQSDKEEHSEKSNKSDLTDDKNDKK